MYILFDHCFVCYDKDPVISYNSLFIISNVIKKFWGLDPTMGIEISKEEMEKEEENSIEGGREGKRKQRKVRNKAKGIIAKTKKGRNK